MQKSFLSYLGGKSLLANKIIPKIPPHKCYCEVFAGAAWILFKKEPSEVEIINDINADLVTLYRVIKHHMKEFVRHFEWMVTARDEFDRSLQENPKTLTDIQRAARFYYLIRNAYGSKIFRPTFNINTTRRPRLNLLRIEEEISAAHLRLSDVYIENLPYEKLIRRFDRPSTFFYLDPPYYGCEKDYGDGIFSREDFGALAGQLAGIQGKFILSINDRKETREIFKAFFLERVTTTYTTAAKTNKKVTELLIRNYKP